MKRDTGDRESGAVCTTAVLKKEGEEYPVRVCVYPDGSVRLENGLDALKDKILNPDSGDSNEDRGRS